MWRIVNVAGQTFGRLAAIYPTEKRVRGRVIWVFRCVCGEVVEKPASRVKSGEIKSCGCLSRMQASARLRKAQEVAALVNFRDLSNKRFSRLKVLELYRRGMRAGTTNHDSLYLCRCRCGNEIVVRSGSLKSGNTRSCGCLKSELLAKRVKAQPRSHGKFVATKKGRRDERA